MPRTRSRCVQGHHEDQEASEGEKERDQGSERPPTWSTGRVEVQSDDGPPGEDDKERLGTAGRTHPLAQDRGDTIAPFLEVPVVEWVRRSSIPLRKDDPFQLTDFRADSPVGSQGVLQSSAKLADVSSAKSPTGPRSTGQSASALVIHDRAGPSSSIILSRRPQVDGPS